MGAAGRQCKLLFTRSLSFHQIILHGQGGASTQTPGGKTWLCGDCGMQMTEQGSQNMWNHTHSPLEIHIHLFISQISVGNLPCAPGSPSWRWGGRSEQCLRRILALTAPLLASRSTLTFPRANSRQPILQTGHLRLREGKRLAQGHTAIQWQNQELNQRGKVHLTLPPHQHLPLSPSPTRAPFLATGWGPKTAP